MAELPSQDAYPAQVRDDALVIHVRNVRQYHTSVKDVDYIHSSVDSAHMTDMTTGLALLALKKRVNLSLEKIALAAGYAGRSSIQTFFHEAYKKPLDTTVAGKLAEALEGKGSPPIERAEIMSLTGVDLPASNARVVPMEGAALERPQENLPVWGSALGSEREFEGEAAELTRLNTGDIVEYVRRPVILNGKKNAYALYVQGSSMHPALPDGEMIVAVRDMAMGVGDNVVVYLRAEDPEDDDGESARGVLVKELIRRTASYVELRQYQPLKDFRVSMGQVVRIDRVLTRREMLS